MRATTNASTFADAIHSILTGAGENETRGAILIEVAVDELLS